MIFFVWSLFGSDELEIVKQVEIVQQRSSVAVEWEQGLGVSADDVKNFELLLRGDLNLLLTFDVKPSLPLAMPLVDRLIAYKGNGTKWVIHALLSKENDLYVIKLSLKPLENGEEKESTYRVSRNDRYPFLVHKMSNEIAKHLGFRSAPWMEKFVVMSVFNKRRQNDIVIADYSLTYRKTLMSGGMFLFPKWANTSQEGFYYTDLSQKPTLYYYDMYKGEKHPLLSSDGMMVCSDVSRDGKKLLVTMAPQGQPDIYLIDLVSGTQQQVTKFSGIDVSGQFIERDQRIAFVSDRLGYPTIFAQDLDGSDLEQLTFQGKNNTALSASENTIVYASGDNGYHLYSLSSQGGHSRRLTSQGRNLFPKVVSTGDAVLFIRNGNGLQNGLGIVRIPSGDEFVFPTEIEKIHSLDW